MADVTVSSGIPSDAYWVSATLRTPSGRIVDSIEGASTADELTFHDVPAGTYEVVKTTLSQSGRSTSSVETVTVAPPPPPPAPRKRCEVKDWFETPPMPPPPPPRLSVRCEVKDWF